MLSKALEPPPEKFHGLKDVDARFRHREQDLVANVERTRETLRARYKMIAAIRQFCIERDFIEVETPMLQVDPRRRLGQAFHHASQHPRYAALSAHRAELHLKRLVIGGLSEKVFEIDRSFRNEGSARAIIRNSPRSNFIRPMSISPR